MVEERIQPNFAIHEEYHKSDVNISNKKELTVANNYQGPVNINFVIQPNSEGKVEKLLGNVSNLINNN